MHAQESIVTSIKISTEHLSSPNYSRQADPELREQEFNSSMKRKNQIFLPQRISQAVTTLGWIFVVTGIILNQLGYAWVQDPSGGIGIGTLDQSNFQREVMREGRRKDADDVETPAMSVSKGWNANKHIFSWIDEEGDSQTV